MQRYVIRHGETGIKRVNRVDFGVDGPPLNSVGIKQARRLKTDLEKLNTSIEDEKVAVSELIRTHQTAKQAGFSKIKQYPELNEISTGLPPEDLKKMILDKQVPKIVLDKAQAILDNPPTEKVIITHGLIIIGLQHLLGIVADTFDPPKCSINFMDF